MTAEPPLATLREGARAAVAEAAGLLRGRRGGALDRWDKAPGDPVTDADIQVNRLLRRRLEALDPAIGWLSEESEDDPARLDRRRVWLVDPIDGTRAFAEGLPEFSVSLALVEDGRPVLAFVAAPATGEWFEAVAGGGAFAAGERVRVGRRATLPGGTIACSRWAVRQDAWRAAFAGARLVPAHSLALAMARVAAGRIDGLLIRRLSNEWDVAAGDLLVSEAGGRFADLDGAPPVYNREEPRLARSVAAAPGLFDLLTDRLRDLTGR